MNPTKEAADACVIRGARSVLECPIDDVMGFLEQGLRMTMVLHAQTLKAHRRIARSASRRVGEQGYIRRAERRTYGDLAWDCWKPIRVHGLDSSKAMAMATEETGRLPQWPRAAASAAIFRGPEVLLVRRGKGGPLAGLWSLPGGHIEPGEPARAAALREVHEETGVVAELTGLVDIHEVIRRGPAGDLAAHYLLTVFYGRWVSGEPAAGDDVTAARFVPLDAVEALPTTDGAPDFIQRAWRLLKGITR